MLIVTLQNISGTDDIADYDWHVYVNSLQIDSGTLIGHKREDGWAILLDKLAKQKMDKEKCQKM